MKYKIRGNVEVRKPRWNLNKKNIDFEVAWMIKINVEVFFIDLSRKSG